MTTENNTLELNIREILKPYLRKWHWFALSFILMCVLAVIYIKFTQPVYKTQTSILIKDAQKMSNASGDFGVLAGLGGLAGMGTNSIENELEVFKSKKIAEDVIQDLKLQTRIFSREKYYDVELYKDTSPFIIQIISEKPDEELPKEPVNILVKGDEITLSSEELKNNIVATFNKTIALPYANFMILKNPKFNAKKVQKMEMKDLYFTYDTLDNLSDDLQKNMNVDLINKDATVIGLSLSDSNKEKARDILNAIVDLYNFDAISDKNTESKKTKDFIDDRIKIISGELGDVETEKERFKVNNSIVDLTMETGVNLETSAKAKEKLLEVETQLQLNDLLLNYINKQNSSELLPVNIGLDNDAAAKSIETYNALVLQRNKLLENATPHNPLVQEANAQIENMRKSIREGLVKNKSSLQFSAKEISGEYGNLINKMRKVPTQEKIFRGILRQQQVKEGLYVLLLQKREEAAISLAMTANKARVIDRAYTDKKPIAPKKMFILLGAGLIGLLLPFGYVYIKNLLNNTIIDKHDLEKLSDITVISEIPRLTSKTNHLIQPNDITPLAEAFRIMVTNLRFLLPHKEKGNTIFVTSSVKGEGKTFISVNLAISLANRDKKVVIVGSDIRNPQLQRYDVSKKTAKGLTEFLYGEITNEADIIHKSQFSSHCDVIFSGSIPPNPVDLLENGRYEILINTLKEKYDYIILDTAPMMLVTDSFLISDFADVVLYVTRSEATEKQFIDFANKNVKGGKVANVAFVLNDLHKNNFGYGNKYGYGYHAEEKSWFGRLKEKIFG